MSIIKAKIGLSVHCDGLRCNKEELFYYNYYMYTGWSYHLDGWSINDDRDLCPSCLKKENENNVR